MGLWGSRFFFFFGKTVVICMYMEGSPPSRITLYSFILPDLLNVCFGACPALLPVHLGGGVSYLLRGITTRCPFTAI